MGCASVSARENGSLLCDDAFCACGGRRMGGRAGGRVNKRATRRPGDRAGRHAGGSTVPWGWCGRACTGLVRAHQRAHGGIPTPPDESLTRIYLSLPPSLFAPPIIPAIPGPTTGPFQPVQDRPQVLWCPSPDPRAAPSSMVSASLPTT